MKSLNKEILRLALPSILANITVPLVGMVDIAVAGHLCGNGSISTAAMIGGVTVGSLLFDLLYWNFGFLRISTGGLTAQAFGSRNMEECANTLMRSLSLALLISIAILLLQWPFQKCAFLIVHTTPEVHALALKYFFIRIWAAPATLSLMTLRGWFVGMQDTFSSMLTDLVINSVNIISSITLTLGIGDWNGMGFVGIATGTVIAQYSGLLLAACIVLTKYRTMHFSIQRLNGEKFHRLLSMNTDLFFRSMCFIVIYVGFTTLAARYGNLFLSVSAILMKILMLFSYITDGFAYSGEALVGRFIGEHNPMEVKRTIRLTFVWSMGVAGTFIAFYGLAGEWMVHLMTSNADVAGACMPFMWWLLLMPPLGCAAFTWDGIYEGATLSRHMRNSMIYAMLGFFGIYLAGIHLFGIDSASSSGQLYPSAMHLLMVAYFTHLLARTVYLTLHMSEIVSRSQ